MSTSTSPAWPARQDAAVIGLVSTAHCISHFSQLLLAPLFPWLKTEFGVSYTELGLLMTIFFAVSCGVQALSGFIVDRFGPRPVLFGGMALLAAAAFGFASSTSYAMLAVFSVIAGVGNGVFHPVDYSLLNRRVHSTRLGHAYSAHGISGSLGWAAAPALLVPIAVLSGWRSALVVAGLLALLVLGMLLAFRRHLTLEMTSAARPAAAAVPVGGGSFGFLAIPAVWMCFWFFLLSAIVLSGMQAFSTQAASQLHAVPTQLAAMCLTVYMLGSASGMVVGGFLASNPDRCERVVGFAFSIAALFALALGFAPVAALLVPVLFAGMGIAMGIASPSRDLLVKRSSPENATGRVYGVVYSGLDIGQALAPLAFGRLMDMHRPQDVWLGIAIVQALMIVSAFNIQRVRRTPLSAAAA
ncbi:MFS transporter [Piscinibacter koreensis]|uniref:MFS transporter n=1 Tax=Piscinibacter koreensis TaxID=2742824 RepID=A0A7Y6NR20_9BURK|nr:MFS transporter [Schlegelella koreensis]NUZ07724.1 MFS transporter [Schlegelella koreensis]